MRAATRFLAVPAAVFAMAGSGRAEEIPRDQYLRSVPLDDPRIGRQTPASEALHLYGDRADPAYRDADPVDGIDDGRYRILMDLCVRFAPFLVQNTSEFPTNFDAYIENAESFPLFVDTWDVGGPEPRLLGTEGVDFARLGEGECRDADDRERGTVPGREDCRLRDLLDRFAPGAPSPETPADARIRDRPARFEVLFFDFPGDGPGTWSQCYRPTYERMPPEKRRFFPQANVHPFLRGVTDERGELVGYDFVLQYWFFYPSNDSGMNHEGDWEHLNVVISPRSMVEGPLPAETVAAILTGALPATDGASDPLVIRRLDYYFHHSVMVLDLSSPNVYATREAWKRDVDRRPQTRIAEKETWEAVRHLAYVDDAETIVNTHPLGYIGADNKGLDQLLAPPGGSNRNSHGTFPFPGRYTNVGPGGTNDQVSCSVDPRRLWRDLERGKATAGPSFERGRVIGLADPDRLRLVPDWERVIDLVRTDAGVRRDWSWLVLPVRWGYPVTQSPFAGILDHFDTGNVSILGPSYNGGWNASGPAPGFLAYDPHTLPAVFPLALQDAFRNDLGFLNAGLVAFSLPPLDFAARVAAYPFRLALGRRDPVFYAADGLPFRFVGVSSGVSVQQLDKDFSSLAVNAQQFNEFVIRLLTHLVDNGIDSTTVATGTREFLDRSVGTFLQVPFFIGRHFASENLVRNVRSTIGIDAEFNNLPPYRYRADLDMWEYAGSLRYSLSTGGVQPFVKGGYGWSWYRLEDARANGVPFTPANSDWIRPDGIWPNVWHLGTGVELIPWRRSGRFTGGAEIALRLEYGYYRQVLGLDLSAIPIRDLSLLFPTLADVPTGDTVARHDLLIGATVTF